MPYKCIERMNNKIYIMKEFLKMFKKEYIMWVVIATLMSTIGLYMLINVSWKSAILLLVGYTIVQSIHFVIRKKIDGPFWFYRSEFRKAME